MDILNINSSIRLHIYCCYCVVAVVVYLLYVGPEWDYYVHISGTPAEPVLIVVVVVVVIVGL